MYMKWLTEEPVIEEISDDVAINIKRAQAKKVEKKALTLEVHKSSIYCNL